MNINTSTRAARNAAERAQSAKSIKTLINSDARRLNDPRYAKMLDDAITHYEHSKVVADRELELFAVGVEVSTRWAVAAHSN